MHRSYDQNRRFSYEGYLTWGHVYDGRHDVSAMIGASLLQRSSLSLSASRNDLKIDDEDHAYISMATNSSASASGGPVKVRLSGLCPSRAICPARFLPWISTATL